MVPNSGYDGESALISDLSQLSSPGNGFKTKTSIYDKLGSLIILRDRTDFMSSLVITDDN